MHAGRTKHAAATIVQLADAAQQTMIIRDVRARLASRPRVITVGRYGQTATHQLDGKARATTLYRLIPQDAPLAKYVAASRKNRAPLSPVTARV